MMANTPPDLSARLNAVAQHYDGAWKAASEQLLVRYRSAQGGSLAIIGAAANTLATQAFTERDPLQLQAAVDCIESSSLSSDQKETAHAVVDYWAATLAAQLIHSGKVDDGFTAAQFVVPEQKEQIDSITDGAMRSFAQQKGLLAGSTATIVRYSSSEAVAKDFLEAQDYWVEEKVVNLVSTGDMAGAYVTAQTFGSSAEIKKHLSTGLPVVDVPDQVMPPGEKPAIEQLLKRLNSSDDFVFATAHLALISNAVEVLSAEGQTSSVQLQQVWQSAIDGGLSAREAGRVIGIAQEIQDGQSHLLAGPEQ